MPRPCIPHKRHFGPTEQEAGAPARQDVQDALGAAGAVGGDRIQERIQGRVTRESWTHGSSEQRRSWFVRGIESGNPDSCDTFRGRV